MALGLVSLTCKPSCVDPHTSNTLRSRNKLPKYISRTSSSVVGAVVPMESKRSGSTRHLEATPLPFFQPTEDTFPPIKASLACSSRSFRTLNERSAILRDARRLWGTSAVCGYSTDGSEDENLWRSRKLMVSIFSIVDVGNPVIIHFENFVYSPCSNTRRQNDQY